MTLGHDLELRALTEIREQLSTVLTNWDGIPVEAFNRVARTIDEARMALILHGPAKEVQLRLVAVTVAIAQAVASIATDATDERVRVEQAIAERAFSGDPAGHHQWPEMSG